MIKLPSTTLYQDSREDAQVKQKFLLMTEDYPDLNVIIKALKTGDYENDFLIVEVKASIDDFVSSFTNKKKRKDGTVYDRMDSQLKRLVDMDKAIKVMLINGSLEDAFSRVHPNSIRGMIASVICQGITVLWTSDPMWPDQIYRLHRKSLKYGPERIKSVYDNKEE